MTADWATAGAMAHEEWTAARDAWLTEHGVVMGFREREAECRRRWPVVDPVERP